LHTYFRSLAALAQRVLPNKKWRATAGILFVAVFFVGSAVWVAPAAAQIDMTTIANGVINAVTRLMLQVAVIFIQLAIFFLRFFIVLAGYNNYINAPVVLLGWNMVRDVTNMFFVVILMVIAFATILGLEQYEWRKTLVKLIIAAIFVNFSNLILQLIIDVSQVFTITFLNAIAGTAGGNLIQMLNFDSIFSLAVGPESADRGELNIELFGAAVIAVTFAATAMAAMFWYSVIVLIRMVFLWVAIILSPIAFITAVLPSTKKYSDEFWGEFVNHVLVAPIMVFFIWLAFGTFGAGTIDHIESGHPLPNSSLSKAQTQGQIQSERPGTSFNEAGTWDNMANFAVALAFLFVGAERVSKSGVKGGGLAQNAISFGKNVATIASGLSAGRYVGQKGKQAGIGLAKLTAKKLPYVGTEELGLRAKNIGESLKGLYYGRGIDVTEKGEKIRDELQKLHEEMEALKRGPVGLAEDIQELEAKETKAGTDREKEIFRQQIEKKRDLLGRIQGKTGENLQKEIEAEETALQKEMGGGILGRMARRKTRMEKHAAKTEKQAETRKQLLWKRTGSSAGGWFVGMGTKGIGGFLGDRYAGIDGQDRIEEGELQAESLRSRAKDEDKQALGRKQVLGAPRMKYDVNENRVLFQFDKGTVADQIAGHEFKSENYNEDITRLQTEAKQKILSKDGNIDKLADKRALNQLRQQSVQSLESTALSDALSRLFAGSNVVTNAGNLIARGFRDRQAGAFDDQITGVTGQIDNVKKEAAASAKAYNTADAELAALRAIEDEIEDLELALKKATDDGAPAAEIERLDTLRKDAVDRGLREGIQTPEYAARLAAAQQKRDAALADMKQYEKDGAEGKKLAGLEKRRNDIAKQRDDYTKDTFGSVAEKVRMGDRAALQTFIDQQKAGNATDEQLLPFTQALEQMKKGGAVGEVWTYAKRAAQSAESARAVQTTQQHFLDDVEQAVVWDKRGISTPTTALNEYIEQITRSFGQMSQDVFMKNASSALLTAVRSTAKGEPVSDGDKAARMALFNKGLEGGWIDDVISALMADDGARLEITSAMGWKPGEEMTPEKIRDIEMLFATGDLEFAQNHAVVSSSIDHLKRDGASTAQLSKEQILKGIETGNPQVIAELRGMDTSALGEPIKVKFDAMLKDSANQNKPGLEKMLQEKYMKVIQDNQAQFQFLGNLRDVQLGRNHGESAGWSIATDIEGQSVFMPSSVAEARNNVLGDANKMVPRDLSRAHPHMLGNLEERFGQIMTSLNEEWYNGIRGRIVDHLSHQSSAPRTLNMMIGFSARDDISKVKATDGSVELGLSGNRLEMIRDKFAGVLQSKGISQGSNREKAFATEKLLQDILVPMMKRNVQDAAMTMAKVAGGSTVDALTKGKINVRLFNKSHGGMKRYDNINALMADIRKGQFGNISGMDNLSDLVLSDERTAKKTRAVDDDE